jgi:hypothetical protein
MRELSSDEQRLIDMVVARDDGNGVTVESVGDRKYDIGFRFTAGRGWTVSCWLPLAVIGLVDWTRLAMISDHRGMVRDGDWSGIRDSSERSIWAMFDRALSMSPVVGVPA